MASLVMEIFFYHTPDQAPDLSKDAMKGGQVLYAPDCAIVIDVLRATTTIATALQAGAEAVHAFKDLDTLLRISSRWPNETRLLAGERGGQKLDGFDLGNSPLDCTIDAVAGKRIFMSTTNGTRALDRMQGVSLLLTASLTNRAAVVRFLKQRQPHTVWIVAAGCDGKFSLEDTICAGAIACGFGAELDINQYAGNDESIAAISLFNFWKNRLEDLISYTKHGCYLASLGYEEDLDYCTQLDIVNVVPMQVEPAVLKPLLA
jgi:2-phosphosulfolactate phosphatase